MLNRLAQGQSCSVDGTTTTITNPLTQFTNQILSMPSRTNLGQRHASSIDEGMDIGMGLKTSNNELMTNTYNQITSTTRPDIEALINVDEDDITITPPFLFMKLSTPNPVRLVLSIKVTPTSFL